MHGGVTMDNTNAERKKKHLEAQVDAAREKYRADLAKNQQPQVVLAINMHFSSRKLGELAIVQGSWSLAQSRRFQMNGTRMHSTTNTSGSF